MVKSYETLVDSNTKVDVNAGMVAAGRLQSLIDSRDYGREIAELRFQLGQIIGRCVLLSRSRCGRRSFASWISWSSARRRSTSALTPTMTKSPSTRPSSSTMTTSFDLRRAHRRHRGRWGPLPVVDGAFAVA